MKTIHKYPLTHTVNNITMPTCSIVRHVAEQPTSHAVAMLWAEVDTDNPPETRTFSVYGTGNELPNDPGVYIGTILTCEGQFVWHVYEDMV